MIELPYVPFHRGVRGITRKAFVWFLFDEPIGRTAFDLRCGWHSGIRPCCIAWFVTVNRWIAGTAVRRWYFRLIDRQSTRLGEQGKLHFDHVPCPLCLARGRAVVLRDCTCAAWVQRVVKDPG